MPLTQLVGLFGSIACIVRKELQINVCSEYKLNAIDIAAN